MYTLQTIMLVPWLMPLTTKVQIIHPKSKAPRNAMQIHLEFFREFFLTVCEYFTAREDSALNVLFLLGCYHCRRFHFRGRRERGVVEPRPCRLRHKGCGRVWGHRRLCNMLYLARSCCCLHYSRRRCCCCFRFQGT